MKHITKKIAPVVFLFFSLFVAGAVTAQDKTVNFYNWSDYIAENTLPDFEKKTGVKVNYDTFDSNDVVFAKLLAGNTGYDIVVPSASFLAKQIKSGIFQKLDKSKIPNVKYLDPELMNLLKTFDPENEYGIPYMWGTTGIGVNVNKVKEVLGENAPMDSLSLVFDPKNAAKLAQCGISLLDAPDELFPIALKYLNDDPRTVDVKKLTKKAFDAVMKIRPYLKYIHSSKYIDDLANGEICVAVGWSGDILQARDRADEAENGVEIAYVIPKEGTGVWFDMMAVPKDAGNRDNAYKLINYLLDPKVMGDNTNYIWYPNSVPDSKQYISQDILDDPSIYPTDDAKANLFTFPVYSARVSKEVNKAWTKVKTQ